MSESLVVQARAVSVSFRSSLWPWAPVTPVLDGLSFGVAPGERVAVVGESGAGKSTLLRVLLGHIKPTSGFAAVQAEMQYIPQDPSNTLNPTKSVAFSIAEPLVCRGRYGGVAERVVGALSAVGLDPSMAQRLPSELSGGQRQRVAIARALITSPQVILADEPTSDLDVVTTASVAECLRGALKTTGAALVLVTHDEQLAGHLCDRVVRMQAGRLHPVSSAHHAGAYGLDPSEGEKSSRISQRVPTR